MICASVYWDKERREKTVYGPGEFERLFADKTRVRLFYKDGINFLEVSSLPGLIKHLEQSYPGCSLRLASIREDGGGAIVELAVDDSGGRSTEQLKQLEEEAQQKVEYQRQALAEREKRLDLEGALRQSEAFIDSILAVGHTRNCDRSTS